MARFICWHIQEQALGGERLNKGGVKQKYLRNLLIERLALAAKDVFDGSATATAKGIFTDLCIDVFNALGMSTDGIERAISTYLGKTKKKAAGNT